MLLHLSTDHLRQLSFLNEIDESFVTEFGNISVEFLRSGINKKIFKPAAQKLEVDISIVEQAVMGLMQLFSEASKHKLSEIDFHDSLILIELEDKIIKILEDIYVKKFKETRSVLRENAPTLQSYGDVEWRLDIKLASRSLHQQIEPNILFNLHTQNGDRKVEELMQIDPVNLVHLTNVLEEGLQELKSNHTRRIVRNIT